MAKDSPRQWDTAAANNTDIGGTDISGTTGKVKDGDNAIRSIMAQIAQFSDEMSYPTAGGSANALTLTPATPSAAYATGDVWTFTAASSNTTAATLNISGLGAKAIRKISGGTDVALAAGDIAAAVRYTVTYDSAANSSAGAWILVGGNVPLASTTDVLTNTDAAKAVTPDSLYAIWGKGIDVTAASTLTLGEGGLFNVIGDTGITDIDFAVPADGRRATLIFEGAPLLTHNATTLNLPGEGNIQVVAGDRCDVVQDDADNIYVNNYTRGGGLALYATKYFSAIITTSGTTQTLTDIPSGYKHLLIQVLGVGNSSGANRILQIELSTDNGSTWGSVMSVSGSVTGTRSGVIWCIGAGENNTEKIVSGLVSTLGSVAGQGQGFEAVKVGVVNAIRLSWNTSSTFNAGYARIYRVA